MFEDSLIESGNKLKTKRGLTTSFTFIMEIILVGVMVLIPLLFTEALPKAQLLTGLVAPPPPPPPPPPPAAVVKVVKIQTNMINDQLRTPTKIPKKVEIIKEEEAPPQMARSRGRSPGWYSRRHHERRHGRDRKQYGASAQGRDTFTRVAYRRA